MPQSKQSNLAEMGQCCFFSSTAFIQAETQNTCSGGKEHLLNTSYWDPKICVVEFDEDTACKKYKIYNKWGLLVTDSGDVSDYLVPPGAHTAFKLSLCHLLQTGNQPLSVTWNN